MLGVVVIMCMLAACRRHSEPQAGWIGDKLLSIDNEWNMYDEGGIVCFSGHTQICAEAHSYAGSILGTLNSVLPVTNNVKLSMYLVDTDEDWNRLAEHGDHRQDGLAMQIGPEILIHWTTNDAENLVRLSHELVHYRIWQRGQAPVPIWLDEGIASSVGWKAALAVSEQEHIGLFRTRTITNRSEWLSLDELTAYKTLPDDPETARLIYIQSEALINELVRRHGNEIVTNLLDQVGNRHMLFREFLQIDPGYSESDIEDLEEQYRKPYGKHWRKVNGW